MLVFARERDDRELRRGGAGTKDDAMFVKPAPTICRASQCTDTDNNGCSCHALMGWQAGRGIVGGCDALAGVHRGKQAHRKGTRDECWCGIGHIASAMVM